MPHNHLCDILGHDYRVLRNTYAASAYCKHCGIIYHYASWSEYWSVFNPAPPSETRDWRDDISVDDVPIGVVKLLMGAPV